MFDSGSWIPYFAVILVSYAAFVFISESINPFKIKKDQSHRRRRLAKSLALIFFVVATIALVVEPYLGLSRSQLGLAVAALFAALAIKPLYKYFRFTRKTISPSVKDQKVQKDKPVTSAPSSPIDLESMSKAKSTPTLTISSAKEISLAAQYVAKLDQLDATPQQPTISRSEEHQLELEISDSSHDSDFDDLDQTIAEADFIDADLTISETNEIAQPDRSNYASNVESISAKQFNNDSEEHGGEDSSNPTETLLPKMLLKMLNSQNEKIQHLARNNQSLINDRESLTDELSNLKFSLKKVNAIARKGIAQRDQAIKLKNNALTLASMEQKKRKLTEIKARKALMKMSNSLKALNDQSAG